VTATSKPANRIKFRYDAESDVVIANPDWRIETEADIATWALQYVTYLAPFRRKMDLVIDLEKFDVLPKLGAAWGAARAKIAHEYLRFHVRVHASHKVQLFVNTSGVQHSIATDEAPSVPAAIEIVKRARQAEKARAEPPVGPMSRRHGPT
jgi:hypothetical protein